FRPALLFRIKPLLRNHCRNKVLIDLVAEVELAGANLVTEERVVAVQVLEQLERLMNFTETRAVVPHLPRQPAALPRFRIGHNPLDGTRFTAVAPLLALVHADLYTLTFEAKRNDTRLQTKIR